METLFCTNPVSTIKKIQVYVGSTKVAKFFFPCIAKRSCNNAATVLITFFAGLIDFGEMTLSKYVFEVATFQVFMMISAQRRGYDIMHTADVALSGFEEIIKLNDEERSCLKLCNIARLIILISASGLVLSANETLSNVQIKLWYDEAIKLLLKVIQYQ